MDDRSQHAGAHAAGEADLLSDAWLQASRRQGADMASTPLVFTGMVCAACAPLLEAALAAEPGVQGGSVSYAGQRGMVRWDPDRTGPARILAAVARAGYGAALDTPLSAQALRRRAARAELWRLFVAVLCMSQVMMYTAPFYLAAPGTLAPDLACLLLWAAWLLTLPVLLFAARPLFAAAWRGLRAGQVRMELPAVLGLGVAFAAGTAAAFGPVVAEGDALSGDLHAAGLYFDSVTMFASFLLGGRWLVSRAQDRAAAALDALAESAPQQALRLREDGSTEAVVAALLRPGDRLRVPAGAAFCADGPLLEGDTSVDESLLTGESRPVRRRVGDEAVAGSLNLGAPVVQQVARLGADTRHGAILALLRGSLAQRPALLSAVDRAARPFLWGVLGLATLAAVVWHAIDPARALPVAVAVLVVTCPCALSLAAPATLVAAAGALARRGILLRRLDALEALARLDTLFLDKTGTLTEDRLAVQGLELLAGTVPRAAVVAHAAALAAASLHPASRAVSAWAAGQPPALDRPLLVEVQEHPGRGVEGRDAHGRCWRLGARLWVAGHARGESRGEADDGASGLCLGVDGQLLAHLPLAETLRPDAAATVATLRSRGVALVLASGDTPLAVAALARRLGITRAHGGLAPQDKRELLAQAQAGGHRIGMVGDGINDAPVLARADVSFSFAQGAAVARAQADCVLLQPRLADVALAHAVARRALRIVRQNIAWAVGYNLLCVPLALLGQLPSWLAAAGMAGSSLAVVANALRAGRIPDDAAAEAAAAAPLPLACAAPA